MVHAQQLTDEVEERRDLFRARAADWNCGYLDIDEEWFDRGLQEAYDPVALANEAWLPLHHDDEGYVLVATSVEPTPDYVRMIEEAVGAPVCLAVTSDWDLDAAIARAYAPSTPEPRARNRRGGRLLAVPALLALAAALFFAAGPTLLAVATLTSGGFLLGVGAAAAVRLRADAGEPTGDDLRTLLHHLRHPRALTREHGFTQAPAVLLRTGGGPAALLLTPPLYVLFGAALALPAERVVPAWLVAITLASLLVGNTLLAYVEILDAFRHGRRPSAGTALLRPLRWLRQSATAYQTLWRLLT
ncbi:hypothetical protein [Asanoa siamensis]|uniref:Type II secretion system protein GspE N-terminal domain-containing protein n=1 Tax=Asanoa siamensis TaxID=926357 RepID=A0ABQ4CL61_9ACTN|nr:hypothetical protein [Asanoa siamensis]GIF72033.1 hypothetical protein Asi02nite_15510 [Asanoa siamensis]